MLTNSELERRLDESGQAVTTALVATGQDEVSLVHGRRQRRVRRASVNSYRRPVGWVARLW